MVWPIHMFVGNDFDKFNFYLSSYVALWDTEVVIEFKANQKYDTICNRQEFKGLDVEYIPGCHFLCSCITYNYIISIDFRFMISIDRAFQSKCNCLMHFQPK